MNKDKLTKIWAAATVASIITMVISANTIDENSKTIRALKTQIEDQAKTIEQDKEIKSKSTQSIQDLENQIVNKDKELESARRKIEEYNKVTFFTPYDVTVESKTDIVHMQRALKGTNLYQDARAFIDAEKTYGVNAYFLAAIAAQESSWGTSQRAMYQNNLTGHAVYSRGATGTYFDSRYQSIMSTAKLLKKNYLTIGGPSYNGLGIVDINKSYCFKEDKVTIDFNWSASITQIAGDLHYKADNFNRI